MKKKINKKSKAAFLRWCYGTGKCKNSTSKIGKFVDNPSGKMEVGTISKRLKALLGSKSNSTFLSSHTAIKNKAHHPELTRMDYEVLKRVLKKHGRIEKSRKENHAVIFSKSIKGNKYKTVVKTTLKKDENFIQSHHKVSNRRLREYFKDIPKQ